jgi:hypothetical protein
VYNLSGKYAAYQKHRRGIVKPRQQLESIFEASSVVSMSRGHKNGFDYITGKIDKNNLQVKIMRQAAKGSRKSEKSAEDNSRNYCRAT